MGDQIDRSGSQRWLKPDASSGVIDTVIGCLVKWAIDVAQVVEQDRGEVAADALAHEDALHGDVGDGCR